MRPGFIFLKISFYSIVEANPCTPPSTEEILYEKDSTGEN